MKKVFCRLIIATKIFRIEEPITIWLVPCKSKRMFPTNEMIGPKHINGGYTYLNQRTIYVYRYEEFPKVLLHEVLHNSILNTHTIPVKSLYQAFQIDTAQCETQCKTVLEPNEAVIEAWTMMFHLTCLSIENKESLQKLYNEEIEWSLYQSKKLLEYQISKFPLWQEQTPSYSYIRLKTCLLYYWKQFEQMSFPYQGKELESFFLTHNLTPKFLESIQKAPQFKSKSFRMTRFGHL